MSTQQNTAPDSEKEQDMRDSIPLWRNLDYVLLLSGQAVSSVGSQVSLVAFPLLILALTHSPAEAGLMTALRAVPFALLCLPAGALVDRWNRKRVMLLADSGRAIALGSIPVALVFGQLTFLQLSLVSLVEGTLFVFFSLAENAAIPHVVTKKQLSDAMSQDRVAYSLSSVIGPALGPILYSISSMLPFIADAVSYAASVISLCFIRTQFQEERMTDARVKQNMWKEIGEGVVWLWQHPLIRFIAILTFGINTPCTGYVLVLLVLAGHMHASNTITGLIFASGGIGSVLGALLVGPLQKRFSFGQVIITSTWVWVLTWLFYAIAPNPLLPGIANTISFIVVPIYSVTQYTYRIAVIPDRLQGRVNSVFRLIAFGGQPLGIAITGLLIQGIGPNYAVIVLFIPQGILAIAVTLNRYVREAPRVHG
ncbi:MAG TPA: MFS transporter [Ktedonobacteraceae bacterium]|nr:MFS transporter [Ktedonobacteraceae bacterium]